MWIKKNIKGQELWTIGKKYIYHERSSNDIDLLNDLSEKYTLAYGHAACIEESIDDEHTILPAGVYKQTGSRYSDRFLCKVNSIVTETLLELEINKDILKDFYSFQANKHQYNRLNLRFRRGVLLYGPPGTGKTSIINKIIKDIVKENYLVIYLSDLLSNEYIQELKKDNRQKIMILEEITEMSQRQKDELLEFLDGQDSLDNCFIFATTNYPEKLERNLVDRPGRFDKLIKIDYLKAKDIKKYIDTFNLACSESLSQQLETHRLSIAHIKELILLHVKDGINFLDGVLELNNKREDISTKFKDKLQDNKLDDYLL